MSGVGAITGEPAVAFCMQNTAYRFHVNPPIHMYYFTRFRRLWQSAVYRYPALGVDDAYTRPMAHLTANAQRAQENQTVSPPVDNTTHAFERVRAAILTGELAPRGIAVAGATRRQVERQSHPVTRGLAPAAERRADRVRLQPARARVQPWHRGSRGALRDAHRARASRRPPDRAQSSTMPRSSEWPHASRSWTRAVETGVLDASREPHRTFSPDARVGLERRMRRSVEDLFGTTLSATGACIKHRPRTNLRFSSSRRRSTTRSSRQQQSATRRSARGLAAEHMGRTALTVIAEVDKTHDPRCVREALRYVLGAAEEPA